MSTPTGAASAGDAAPPYLILHFDVNGTVVMSDAASGKSVDDKLNSLIADEAYGVVDGDTWVPVESPPGEQTDARVVSYLEYVHDVLHPLPDLRQHAALPVRERAAMVQRVKSMRQEMLRTFTESEAGRRFRPLFESTRRNLIRVPEADGGDDQTLVFLVKSFVRVAQWIAQRAPQHFCLLFRTYGEDYESIVEELAYLRRTVSGVDYLEMNAPDSMAYLIRNGSADADAFLVIGTVHQVDAKRSPDTAEQHGYKVVRGLRALTDHLFELCMRKRVMFVRDDYTFWAAHGEQRHAGKLFPIHQGRDDVFEVFFDDNLHFDEFEETGKLIVDCRDADSLEPLAPADIRGRHLVHAESLAIMNNENYFVEQTEAALQRWAEHRAAAGDAARRS